MAVIMEWPAGKAKGDGLDRGHGTNAAAIAGAATNWQTRGGGVTRAAVMGGVVMRIVAALLILALAPFAATPNVAVAQKPGAEARALASKAYKASRAGRKEEALTLFAKAIRLGQLKGTELAGLHNGRAVILTELERRPEAIVEMGRAIAAAPKHPFYYGNRARIYRAMKLPAKAAADFTRVIDLSAKPGASAYYDRCRAYAEAKARAKAIADCQKALELSPKYGRAARLLAKLKAGS
ncbi:MAG: hypothetical protein OEQ29_12710 [Alphaproteobacteria bacterium]|nr:hypothetical protein [Alphaproteobacteria bacterium]